MDEKIKELKLRLMITYGSSKRNPQLRNRLKKEIARLKTKERKLIIESKRRKTEMAYKEVNPDFWTYEKEGDFIEGILIKKQEKVGENESMLYTIENADGMKNVWGSAILDQRMTLVHVGDQIKITYKGIGEQKKKGKNPPKIFKVEVDKEIQTTDSTAEPIQT